MAGKTSGKSVTAAKKTTGKRAATKREDRSETPDSASAKIDQRIRELGDWRGAVLKRMRGLIHEAVPEVVEKWKWQKKTSSGTPVWYRDGGICTGESYKHVVKLTFFHGASLKDPKHLFNASLGGNMRRAIDIREDDVIDEAAFRELIRAAVAFNVAKQKKGAGRTASKSKASAAAAKPVLLSGGNPQIAKADGDAPVRAYIAAMPGWKSDVGRRLDALIVRNAPGVRKAVRWNSPFYGIEGRGWFLSFHCFTKYVKVTFFRGGSLRPLPPGESKHEEVRYLDIREDDEFDEARMAKWIRQAAALPGWTP